MASIKNGGATIYAGAGRHTPKPRKGTRSARDRNAIRESARG